MPKPSTNIPSYNGAADLIVMAFKLWQNKDQKTALFTLASAMEFPGIDQLVAALETSNEIAFPQFEQELASLSNPDEEEGPNPSEGINDLGWGTPLEANDGHDDEDQDGVDEGDNFGGEEPFEGDSLDNSERTIDNQVSGTLARLKAKTETASLSDRELRLLRNSISVSGSKDDRETAIKLTQK